MSNYTSGIELLQQFKIEPKTGIAYSEVGKGQETLLFIHGLGSNRYAWMNNVSELSKMFKCVAIDLPDYGDSEEGEGDFTVSYFTNRIHDFIKNIELKNIWMIGHSMGAQLSIHFAVQYRLVVKGLILLAPAGIETFNEYQKSWLKQIYNADLMASVSNDQIASSFKSNFHDFGSEAEWMLGQRMDWMKNKARYQRYCAMIAQTVIGMVNASAIDVLPKMNQPALIIYAEEDQLIPSKILNPTLTVDELVSITKAKLQNGDVKTIASAGHFLQVDQDSTIDNEISKFVKSHSN